MNTPFLVMLDNYVSFFKAHERLVLTVVVASFLLAGVNKVLGVWDKHDARKATEDATHVLSDKSANADLQKQVDSLTSQFVKSQSALTAEITALNTALAAKIKADQTAPAPVVAKELGGTPVDNTIVLPLDTARGLLTEIDTIPPLQSELAATKDQLGKSEALVASQTTLVTGLNKQIADQTKACAAEVAQLKVEKRKSWLNGFKWGVITGFSLGLVVHRP